MCQRQQQEPEHPKKGCGECYNTHTQKIEGKKKSSVGRVRHVLFNTWPFRRDLFAPLFYIYMNAHTYPVFFNGTPFLRLVYMFFFFNNIKRSFNFLPPVGRGRERKGLKKIHQKDGLHRQSHQKRDVSAFVPSSSSGKRREKEKEIQ